MMLDDEEPQEGFGLKPEDVEVNLQTQQLNMTRNVNKIVHPFR